MKDTKFIYAKISNDEYENILDFADTLKELSDKLKISYGTLKSAVSRCSLDIVNNCKYIKIKLI